MSVPLLRFASLGDVLHGISTRWGGISSGPYSSLNVGVSTADALGNVESNRRTLLREMDVEPDAVVFARLSHGNDVSVFRRGDRAGWPVKQDALRGDWSRAEPTILSDAVVSDVEGLAFLLTFADCVPLAFADRRLGVVGAAHAGWRGTALGIATEVVRAMGDAFGTRPEDIVAGIGPSIGPCCYQVGPEVWAAFETHGLEPTIETRDSVRFLDLWTTNEEQLRKAGVRPDAIENPRACTKCRNEEWFSHRGGEGVTGRFAMVVGKRAHGASVSPLTSR